MSVEIADESKGGINPWASIIARACEFSDDCHVAKSIRALVYADTHFGRSPKGLFASSLAGSNEMDGSIFLRGSSFFPLPELISKLMTTTILSCNSGDSHHQVM